MNDYCCNCPKSSNAPTVVISSGHVRDIISAVTLGVSDRLSICGYDDTAIASMILPELTTIRQPISDLSGAAADLLLRKICARQLAKKEESHHEMLDFTLIRRQSDAVPQVR